MNSQKHSEDNFYNPPIPTQFSDHPTPSSQFTSHPSQFLAQSSQFTDQPGNSTKKTRGDSFSLAEDVLFFNCVTQHQFGWRARERTNQEYLLSTSGGLLLKIQEFRI